MIPKQSLSVLLTFLLLIVFVNCADTDEFVTAEELEVLEEEQEIAQDEENEEESEDDEEGNEEENEGDSENTDENEDDTEDDTTEEEEETTEDSSEEGTPLVTNMRNFIFGHSLILHATGDDETTVPHWLGALSASAGYSYAVDGQYGFLPGHANLPPSAQWGFQNVPGLWNAEGGVPFSSVDFNTILLTAGNFIQYQGSNVPYDYADNTEDVTPISATLDIVDWLIQQEPEVTIYIYENWPDMDSMINSFPPTSSEFDSYNAHTRGEFHDWWLDYHDTMIANRPSTNVKMIPVGPIMSTLFMETALDGIPVTDLYEDGAPHGRPTLYFLASLITYSAMYGVRPPSDFSIPSSIHNLVRTNYSDIIDIIWEELQSFNTTNGESRVW